MSDICPCCLRIVPLAERAIHRAWLSYPGRGQNDIISKDFRAGWEAREKVPNTLILDTTSAQMTVMPNVTAAAGGIPIQVSRSSPSPCCHCDGTGRERDGSTCMICNGTCCSQHYKGVDPSCGTCRIA